MRTTLRTKTAMAGLALSALTLLGAGSLPVQAAERPTQDAPLSAQAEAKAVRAQVTVAADHIGAGAAIAKAISDLATDDRGEFVKEAVNKAFEHAGRRYNVVIMNLSQGYENRLTGVKLYATVKWARVYYGLWVAEAGQFTNTGDGGYINWGYRGWFERHGTTLTFRQP
ncbi:hypothetical protein [Streptomyces sp. A012304]|uniref:hypothetical protein n=1 Tax=Streptomyces sp. A012304 TaxID=375446 RepID=UPI00222E1186|nr:hypothetical protein [Streptomyces sp. A012304]GKQ40225.1 stress response protein YvgO [Streptomyces sp. A012304]